MPPSSDVFILEYRTRFTYEPNFNLDPRLARDEVVAAIKSCLEFQEGFTKVHVEGIRFRHPFLPDLTHQKFTNLDLHGLDFGPEPAQFDGQYVDLPIEKPCSISILATATTPLQGLYLGRRLRQNAISANSTRDVIALHDPSATDSTLWYASGYGNAPESVIARCINHVCPTEAEKERRHNEAKAVQKRKLQLRTTEQAMLQAHVDRLDEEDNDDDDDSSHDCQDEYGVCEYAIPDHGDQDGTTTTQSGETAKKEKEDVVMQKIRLAATFEDMEYWKQYGLVKLLVEYEETEATVAERQAPKDEAALAMLALAAGS